MGKPGEGVGWGEQGWAGEAGLEAREAETKK